jgi:hypothetical protein
VSRATRSRRWRAVGGSVATRTGSIRTLGHRRPAGRRTWPAALLLVTACQDLNDPTLPFDPVFNSAASSAVSSYDPGYYHCHIGSSGGGPGGPIMTALSASDSFCHWVPDYSGWDPRGPHDPSLGGGGFYSAPLNIENDPYHSTRGSLWADAIYGLLEANEPRCDRINKLHPAEQAWCLGDQPDSATLQAINTAAAAVVQRCPQLTSAWNKVTDGIRLFHPTSDFGGGTRAGARWILISYGWANDEPELIVAHELLHHENLYHDTAADREAFKEQEITCSGGRSVFP